MTNEEKVPKQKNEPSGSESERSSVNGNPLRKERSGYLLFLTFGVCRKYLEVVPFPESNSRSLRKVIFKYTTKMPVLHITIVIANDQSN